MMGELVQLVFLVLGIIAALVLLDATALLGTILGAAGIIGLAVGALVITLVQEVALLPLGFGLSVTVSHLVRTAALSGLWCGLVSAVKALDIPRRWRAYRVRRLR